MMHRYVIALANDEDTSGFERLVRRIGVHLGEWAHVLDYNLVSTWVFSRAPSRLSHRKFSSDGCIIGIDFNSNSNNPDSIINDSWGSYIAVSVDRDRGRVSVLRDPTGRIECWRLSLKSGDILFSHYSDVYWLQDRQSGIDWEYLTHHLNQDWTHGEHTCLEGVKEVLPGEELTYMNGCSSKAMRWWPHEISKNTVGSIDAAQSVMRRSAEISVEAWGRQYERITLDLSGGLDSAIVLGLLRRHAHHQNVLAINRVTPGREGDERFYAREAAEMHGVRLIEQEPESTDLDFSTSYSRKLMRPRNRILPLGYDQAGADIARRYNSEAFFTGTGGDHLFYDNLKAEAACDYLSHRKSIKGYLDTAVYLAQLSKSTVWEVNHVVASYYLGKRSTIDGRSQWKNAFLTPAATEGVDFDRYAHPWAIAAMKHSPPAKLTQIFNILELQRHYHRFGRADVAEETHVLFSQPLLEACLRIPAHWFGVGGVQRGLARRAFSDLLPACIRERRSKGAIGPYFADFLRKRLPKIRELLLEGRLASKGLVDRQIMEEALTPFAMTTTRDLAVINVCLTAELWVRQAESDIASALAEGAKLAASA